MSQSALYLFQKMSVFEVFKVFYGYVLRRKALFVFTLLLIVASAIFSSLSPYFYKVFVETIPSLNLNKLLWVLAFYMAIRIFGLIFGVLSHYFGDRVLIKGSADARVEIFKHVQDLDFSFHTQKSTGSLISSFKRGDGSFFTLFYTLHYPVLRTIINFAVMLYFFISIDIYFALLAFFSLFLMLLATRYLIENNVKTRNAFNDVDDQILGIITDNLINFETVKLFAKENWEILRLRNKLKNWYETLWHYGNSFRYIDVGVGLIDNISVFLILALCIYLTVLGKFGVGNFVLVTTFISSFYSNVWDLVWSMRDVAKNFADIQKYFGLFKYNIDVPDPICEKKLKSVKGTVMFKDVSYSYKGGTKNAIKNFNVSVLAGESIALVGKSGSGKTTIAKLLLRFFDPQKGKITIDGVDIRNFKKSTLRNFFGVVPQEPVLFNNTIAFNIGYGKSNAKISEIKTAAKLANISSFIEKLPEKYNTNVGERGIKLSGGQKQRLAIARMILSNPDIIIFDEATSHLDSESERLIQDAFWKVAKGKTTFIIAHRLSTIKKSDRIFVMEKGEIVEQGSHNDLIKKRSGIYKHLWDLQLSN